LADDAVADFKLGNRRTWAAGDWDEISKLIAGAGPALLDRVAIEPDVALLDVGTGSGGTVAIPAAQRGARVVGVDLTPELFDDARRRAAEAGVGVEWVAGDAESLPFADETFDRVLSSFGHMFAPRHAVAAAELARVCKPGGILGTATWTPEGGSGVLLRTVAARLPPPPDFAESPLLWGTEDHVREMLEPHGFELEFERDVVVFEFSSVEAWVDHYAENFGPIVMAKATLGDAWPELRTALIDTFESLNLADDGGFRTEAEYLRTVGKKG
jgi:SAM-dependent methyltransferase